MRVRKRASFEGGDRKIGSTVELIYTIIAKLVISSYVYNIKFSTTKVRPEEQIQI